MFSRSHLLGSVAAVVALGFAINTATASMVPFETVINIDFNIVAPVDEPEAGNHFTGQGAYSDPGNNIWNEVRADHDDSLPSHNPARGGIYTDDVFVGSLLDSKGNATTASVLVHADPEGVDTFALGFTDRGSTQLGRMAQDALDLMRNQITALAGATAKVTIGGLEAGSLWDVYLYGAGGGSPHDTIFTINSVEASTTGVTGGPRNLTLGQDYVIISDVLVGIDGTIDIFYRANPADNNDNEGPFNGLQLVLIPEPASLVLMGVGGLLMLRRRRSHV